MISDELSAVTEKFLYLCIDIGKQRASKPCFNPTRFVQEHL